MAMGILMSKIIADLMASVVYFGVNIPNKINPKNAMRLTIVPYIKSKNPPTSNAPTREKM